MSKIISLDYNGELGYASTIEDVILSVFQIHLITPDKFLDFKNGDFTNRELVFLHYSIGEKIKYNLADEQGNITKTYKDITPQMRCPYITFFTDASYVTKDILVSESSLLADDFSSKEVDEQNKNPNQQGDGTEFIINKFFFEKVKLIPKITKVNPTDNSDDSFKKTTRKQYINPRVWIWCKSLNNEGVFNNNSIFDLTPFLKNLEFSNSENGGQFSFGLLNIEGFINVVDDYRATTIWHPRKDRYVKFSQDDKINYFFKNMVNARFNKSFSETEDAADLKRTKYDDVDKAKYRQSNGGENIDNVTITVGKNIDYTKKSISSDLFFKNLISENDIVFLTFRDDEDNEVTKVDDFFISNDSLPGMNWEMIGLVDRNSVSINYDSTEHNVSVSGRDLMKLLIEDGSYFFANSFSDDDVKSIFENIDLPNRGDGVNASNKVTETDYVKAGSNRLVMSGLIDMLFNPAARNVQFVMNLLVSTLSNIEICPSRLFECQENKTKFQIPKFQTVTKSSLKNDNIDL